MSSVILLLAFSVTPVETASAAEPAPKRPFHIINGELRDALRREATTDDPAARAQAVHDLTDLHMELVRDPRYSTSDTLKSYRAKIYSRLLSIKKKIQWRLAREAKNSSPQQVETSLRDAAYATSEISSQLGVIGETVGGPANLLALAGGQGGQARSDHGQALVDLIERTINPDFWDTVGGPGSIYYFQPLHALVVSATAEVHENLGGVLRGLRKAAN